MAREQRSQRRGRRDGGDRQETPKQAPRARQRAQQVRPGLQPQKQQTGRREPKQRGRFVREAAAELKKVDWPGRSQLVQSTVAVIIACAIVGAFLYVADAAFQALVENVILRGAS